MFFLLHRQALNETLQLVIEDNKLLRLENSAFLAKLAHLESRVNVMHEESQRLENQVSRRMKRRRPPFLRNAFD